MVFSRRSLGGLFAGAGAAIGAQRLGVGGRDIHRITPVNAPFAEFAKNPEALTPVVPRMGRGAALRLALLDPHLKALFEQNLAETCKEVHALDPDLEVLKALSPMAKVFHQRQRNIARERERLMRDMDEDGHARQPFAMFVDALMKLQYNR